MKQRIPFLIVLFLFFFNNKVLSQTSSEKETFDDAEYFFAQDDYSEALTSYISLFKRGFKDNANINYRIGICYLHSNTEKDKAISFLERAVKKVSEKYSEGSIKEINAPYDAYLYLGNALRINMQLDKAIEAYGKYSALAKQEKENTVNLSWAKNQIEACKRAKIAISKPGRIKITLLGRPINTSTANYNPVVSTDENLIIFVTHQRFYDAIMSSKKTKNKWENPENITPDIQSDGDQFPCFLSFDGKTLYLSKVDNYNSDIYVSHFDGKKWSPSKPLNNEINTKYWESHACETPDGKTLYFTSNRPQSLGGTDIFYSQLDKYGEWDTPKNLGNVINTPFNEESPFITADGNTLYFSSQGHESIGGYDIFYSKKDNKGNWSKPVNLGYPVNSTDDDLFYVPVQNGNYAYQAKNLKNGIGDLDIVRIEVFSKDHPFKYDIKGRLTEFLKDAKPESYQISIINPETRQVLDSTKPLLNGNFSFNQVAGNYSIQFQSEEFQATSKNFVIPEDYKPDSFILTSDLLNVTSQYNTFISGKKKEIAKVEPEKAVALKEKPKPEKGKKETILTSNKPAVIHNILFSFNDYTLSQDGENEIKDILKIMNSNSTLEVEVIGYTDSKGSDKYNLKLSEKRAKYVKEVIVKRGIDSNRIITKGLGKTSPVALNENPDGSDNPDGRSYNRRVEFRIIKCDNKNITIEPIKVPEKLQVK